MSRSSWHRSPPIRTTLYMLPRRSNYFTIGKTLTDADGALWRASRSDQTKKQDLIAKQHDNGGKQFGDNVHIVELSSSRMIVTLIPTGERYVLSTNNEIPCSAQHYCRCQFRKALKGLHSCRKSQPSLYLASVIYNMMGDQTCDGIFPYAEGQSLHRLCQSKR